MKGLRKNHGKEWDRKPETKKMKAGIIMSDLLARTRTTPGILSSMRRPTIETGNR